MARLKIARPSRHQPERKAKTDPKMEGVVEPTTKTKMVAAKKLQSAKTTKTRSKIEAKKLAEKIEAEKAAHAAAVKKEARLKAKQARSERRRQEKAEKEATAAKKKLPIIPEAENKLLLHPSINLFEQTANAAMINGFVEKHRSLVGDELLTKWNGLLEKGKKAKAMVWRDTFRAFFVKMTSLDKKAEANKESDDAMDIETDKMGDNGTTKLNKMTNDGKPETAFEDVPNNKTLNQESKKDATDPADPGTLETMKIDDENKDDKDDEETDLEEEDSMDEVSENAKKISIES